MYQKPSHATRPGVMRSVSNGDLRALYLLDNRFEADAIRLSYTHYERFVVGGAAPRGRARSCRLSRRGVPRLGANGRPMAPPPTPDVSEPLLVRVARGDVTLREDTYVTGGPVRSAAGDFPIPAAGRAGPPAGLGEGGPPIRGAVQTLPDPGRPTLG